jgi:hypothetical protein
LETGNMVASFRKIASLQFIGAASKLFSASQMPKQRVKKRAGIRHPGSSLITFSVRKAILVYMPYRAISILRFKIFLIYPTTVRELIVFSPSLT